MKVLFIGGTGNISTAVSRLGLAEGLDLYLLNRGYQKTGLKGAKRITGDMGDEEGIKKKLKDHHWDVVVNWIAFKEQDINRDVRLFHGKTDQYIFISSASAYEKPPTSPIITEETPLINPYWEYSRDKITCEESAFKAYREKGFPLTVVRPSLTYEKVIPGAIGSWTDYTLIHRIKTGKPIVVHGDGTSVWTITHAEDFAKGFSGLMGNPKAIGEAFHITTDELLTWNQIYESMGKAVGIKPKMIHMASDFIVEKEPSLKGTLLGDKAHSAIFDNSKIRKFVPSFRGTISFEEGIKRTINWFEADPGRMVILEENNRIHERLIKAYTG